MTGPVRDPSLGTSAGIGRYFGVVSAVPTTLLTGYITLLLASGAWTHRPDFSGAMKALTHVSLSEAIFLLAVTLLIALVLHTVQFGIIQFFEGYWGGNDLMRYLRTRRTQSHLIRLHNATRHLQDARKTRSALESADKNHLIALLNEPDSTKARAYLASEVAISEATDTHTGYPNDRRHVMPTRLGNILRRYEVSAGHPYDLDVLRQATHLALVAPENHVNYLKDQRNALELAVRLCASALLASAATVILMLPWGLWLLLTLVPYTAAYISYRGSLLAAHHYGNALITLVDLNRFRLYEALHMPNPATTRIERLRNAAMSRVAARSPTANIVYDHSKPSTPTPPTQPPGH